MSSINAADKEPRESEIRHQSSQQSWRDSSDSFARLPPQETQARSSFDQARLDETAPQRYSTPSGFRERTPREGQRELPAEPVASKIPPLSWRAVHLNATDHNSVGKLDILCGNRRLNSWMDCDGKCTCPFPQSPLDLQHRTAKGIPAPCRFDPSWERRRQ